MRSARDMFRKGMVWAMLLGVSSKSNIHILLPTFQLGSRIISFKYMHDISNINTIALYPMI